MLQKKKEEEEEEEEEEKVKQCEEKNKTERETGLRSVCIELCEEQKAPASIHFSFFTRERERIHLTKSNRQEQ